MPVSAATAPETTPGERERGSSGGGAAGKLKEAEEDRERERERLFEAEKNLCQWRKE